MNLYLLQRVAVALLFPFIASLQVNAAVFNGASRATAGDSSNALSGAPTTNALTVSCWFKMSIPSSVTLSKDMVILSNRQDSTAGGNFAFELKFNINTGNVEFQARGASGLLTPQLLITQPFLERWYHVAVTREVDTFVGFLDGRQVFSTTQAIGAATNTNGITMGGTTNGANLYGEVIEAAVYRRKLDGFEITPLIFSEQPVTDPDLRGYYKLRKSAVTAEQLKNFAPTPPAGTDPLTGTGVTFEDANQAGEQSTFDSHRNGGRDATAPLSGGFSWERTVFRRPTVGVPFELKIGYNSGNSGGTGAVSGFSPGAGNGLGGGWTHTFDARLVPSITFDPFGPPFPTISASVGLMLWDGSLEVWDSTDDVNFTTRHGEYRGELRKVGSGASATYEWLTPDRLRYVFFTASSGVAVTRGRLKEIRDFSGNVITAAWLADGKLDKVTDTAGGVCQFNYTGSLLTSVGYLGWTATFTHDSAAANRLKTITVACPPAYVTIPAIPTTWGFEYFGSPVAQTDPPAGLLKRIADPRGYNGGAPTYYDLTITYDKYGRVTRQADAVHPATTTAYGLDHTGAQSPRSVTRTDSAGKKWVETFDRKHRVVSRRDPLGNLSTFEINDATGTIAATVEPMGYATPDPEDWKTRFTYDARANVLTRTDALGRVTTWQYNDTIGTAATGIFPLNKPTKEIRPATLEASTGWETNYDYDDAGNLLTQSDAIGTLVTNTHTPRGQLATTTDARGNTTTFTYTAEGYLASRTVPDVGGATRTWTYEYTELGWLKTDTDPLARVSYFFQNINGQVHSVTDPFGRVFNKVFDANGNLTHDYDAKGQLTQHEYDNADQKTRTTTRDLKVWQSFYTQRGELESTRDPSLPAGDLGARTVRYEYDDAGRKTKETDANGFFATFAYDANGNLTRTTDKEGKFWDKTYDQLNRVITDKDPLGDTTTTAFDAAGRLDTVTSPRGFVSRHEYDGRSRLKKWTDPEGNAWIYTYDANGNITRITDALGGHYDMQYGPRNERLREENQDHYVWFYTYDELLRLKTQTDPLPLAGDAPETTVMRTFTYDLASRVEEVVFSTGRRTVFHYDLNNNPDEIRRVIPAQPTTTLTLSYDAMDRVTSSLDAFGKTVGYTFDPAGRVKTIVYPGAKTLTHAYDAAGRLTTLTDWAARVSAFTYDKAGRMLTHAYPNGVLDTISYYDDGTVKKLDYTRAGGAPFTPFALEYAYDRNGNKTQEKKKGVLDWQPTIAPSGTVAPFDETFTFKNNPGSGRLATSADALNPARNFSYTYNAAGDMTLASSPGQTTAFTYDEDHRVLTVARTEAAATTQIENRYDALGRRISRKLTLPGSAAIETRHVLDLTGSMERILCDTTAAGAVTVRYIHGPNGLGYREDASGAITCFHADAIGNIIRITDATGATTAQYAYSPYGRLLATTGSATNPYRFVGAQGVMEELPNLYFMRARYYSAEAGVFLSTDPVRNVGRTWSANAYRYSNGNPSAYIDPRGRWASHAGAYIAGMVAGMADEAKGEVIKQVVLRSAVELGDESTRNAVDAYEDYIDPLVTAAEDTVQGIGLIAAASQDPTGHVAAGAAGVFTGKILWRRIMQSLENIFPESAINLGFGGNGSDGGSSYKAGSNKGKTDLSKLTVNQNSTPFSDIPLAFNQAQTSNGINITSKLTVGNGSATGNGAGGTGTTTGQKNSRTGGGGEGASSSGGGSTYTIKSGDTLGNIASRNGTTAQALYNANRSVIGNNPNLIRPGQRINLRSR